MTSLPVVMNVRTGPAVAGAGQQIGPPAGAVETQKERQKLGISLIEPSDFRAAGRFSER